MSESLFSLDDAAIERAGAKAIAYFKSIGVSDIKTMSREQWRRGCQLILAGAIEAALDRYMTQLEREEAPF